MQYVIMKDVELLHNPLNIMHVVAFASGSGTNFREAILESRREGSNSSIDLLVTDLTKKNGKTIGAIDYAKEFHIPHICVNGFKYCGSWAELKKTPEGIQEYDRNCIVFNELLAQAVHDFETQRGIKFDFAVLAGYMRMFKHALLRRFENRAINVHPARLDELENGSRKYVGENAVYDALNAGETVTRSSIIVVAPGVDSGAILVSGPQLPYRGPRPVTQELADQHQKLQKEVSDWPALKFALHSIANGGVGLHKNKRHPDGNPVVVFRGHEMPYGGFNMVSHYE